MCKCGEAGYRTQLQSELKRRQTINPRYSLRSFSRTVGLSPAFLSKVLRGEKNLSEEAAVRVAQRLRYSEFEMEQFRRMVRFHREHGVLSRHENGAEDDDSSSGNDSNLGLDLFQIISDWYHYALRELTETRDFKAEPRWIANRLGISVEEAKLALDRLERIGLLRRSEGRLIKAESLVSTPSDQPSQALRNHHSQMIEKARSALESQPVHKRDITGITIPIDPAKIALAKEEIRKFRRKMAKVLDSTGAATEVYQLNVQFFSLTQSDFSKE